MNKAMISQPMAGKTEEEITLTKEKAVKFLANKGYVIENTLFKDDWKNTEALVKDGVVNIPLHFLAKSLRHMSLCDTVYFCKGWESARGCLIEHAAAKAYNLRIFYEED